MAVSPDSKYIEHNDVGVLYRTARKVPLHRAALFALVTLLYAAIFVLVYSLSGNFDFGLNAQLMPGGQWRITYVVPSGIAFDQGVQRGDIVTAVDGQALAGQRKPPSFDGVKSLDFVRGEGSQAVRFYATLDSIQNGTENPASRWIYALTSVVFILVGGVAYLKARARKQARNLYAFCAITGGMLLVTTTPGEYSLPSLAMSFVGLLVFACAFALFFLNFPASPPVSPRLTRAVAFAVTGGGVALLGFYIATVFGAIDYAPVRTAMLLYLIVCSLVGLWSLGAQLVGHKSHPEARSQLLIVLLGAGLTFFPSAIFNFLPALILGRPLVDIYVCASTLAIMPLAFTYAISRHQLLGIEALVRRSVIQVITGLAILTIMFLPALAFSGPLRGLETGSVPGAVPVALGMIAFVLSVIHRTLQGRIERWVDKYIYHDAYDYKQALQSLSRNLASEPDLTRLSRMVLKQLCDLMNLAGAALFLVPESELESYDSSESAEAAGSNRNPGIGRQTPASLTSTDIQDMVKRGALRLQSSYGVHPGVLVTALKEGPKFGTLPSGTRRRLFGGSGPLSEAMLGGAPLASQEASVDIFLSGPLNSPPDSYLSRGSLDTVNWFLCLPLRTHGKLIGVAYLAGKRTGEPFTKDDITLLGTLGAHLAQALRNAQLFKARKQEHLEAIEALAASIEAKDGYTGEHCARMVSRAEAIALQLGLDPEDVEIVRLGAVLHDVGKIGIPDSILNKPGRLTSEEFEIMKKHTLIGARIIGKVRGLSQVSDIVRHHHERYDGKGYPFGLSGTDIPLGARIVSVVDTYGAMTEDRVYRVAPGHDRAVEELQRCAGTQLDPLIVETFLLALETSPELVAPFSQQSISITSALRAAGHANAGEVQPAGRTG